MRGGRCGSLEHYARGWYPALHKGVRGSLPIPVSSASHNESAPMKITDLRATTVTVPLEAPLRHSNGAHWGRFVRTIVEVEADNGLVGLGELGGGGASAEAAVRGLRDYLVGHDPFALEALRFALANPTAS